MGCGDLRRVRLKPGLQVPSSVCQQCFGAAVTWGTCPSASQSLLAMALWVLRSCTQCSCWLWCHVCGTRCVPAPLCQAGGRARTARAGQGAGSGCWNPAGFAGERGFLGSPAPESPWGQGTAASPGCRLHLAALSDELPAEGDTLSPASSGKLRFNHFSASALPRAFSGNPRGLSRVCHGRDAWRTAGWETEGKYYFFPE